MRSALATAALALISVLALASSASALEQQIGVAGNDAFGASQGAAYTFASGGASARTETAKLTASFSVAGAQLGDSVAIDGDTILAGAPADTIAKNTAQGSAYTFSRTGLPARRQTGKLSDTDGTTNDFFGFSVALDAGTTVVGAAGRGEVSVFFSPAPTTPLPPPPPPPPTAKPVLSKLAVNPRTIHRNSRHSHSRSSPRGAIAFTLSTEATVKLSFAEILPGRVGGTTCVRPTRANHGRRRCTRMVTVGGLAVRSNAGTNAIALASNLRRARAFGIGNYRLTATPTSASGATGGARATTFRIVK